MRKRINTSDTSIRCVGLSNFSRKNLKKKDYQNYNAILYNTCYINSTMQCLFRLDGFVNNISRALGKELTKATLNLINDMMCAKSKNLSVLEIKQAMIKVDEKYKQNNPEDVNEFISNYINALHEENLDKCSSLEVDKIKLLSEDDKKSFINFYDKFYLKKGESFVLETFYGILRTESYCLKCETIFSVKFHAYNILEIPIYELIKNKYEILDMKEILEKYRSTKEVKNSTCSKCKINTFIRTDILTLPKCLLIYFERNEENNYIWNDINILKEINLHDYLYNKDPNNSDYYYKLKGVIYYSFLKDDLGHYTASCLINNKWIYFDDTFIEEQKNLKNRYEDEKPVLLFYEKIN